MKEHHLKGGFKIEDNKDFFTRMKKLRMMLMQDTLMEEEVVECLQDSNRNKVLVVTHGGVLKSLTSESTTYNPVTFEKELNAASDIEQCQVCPLHLQERPYKFKPASAPG